MTLKKTLFIFICLLCFQSIAQKAYVKEYSITLFGQITDKDNQPVSNAIIRTIYKMEPVAISFPDTTIVKVDKNGKYSLELKAFGLYKIEIMADKKISYHVECLYTEKMASNIHDRKFKLPLDVQLFPQTSKVTVDIYNGGEIIARQAVAQFIPFKRYMQDHDFEIRDGFKTTKKANKYIVKTIKKLQAPKLLGLLASRSEITAVITSETYYPEIRKRWQRFFGITHPNIDKQRAELAQDFFNKISEKDEEGALIYQYKRHTLDMTKTVQADDTKKVFNLFKYQFESNEGKPLSFDVMLFCTETGWKINYITENY